MSNYFYSTSEHGEGYSVFYHTGDALLDNIETPEIAQLVVNMLNSLNDGATESKCLTFFNKVKRKLKSMDLMPMAAAAAVA